MHATTADLPVELKTGDLETHGDDWGGISVRSLSLPAGTDLRPIMKGLPHDSCQCPHWGYVLEGSITVRYADGTEETTRAGEAYYWPAGHTARMDEDTAFLEIGPVPAMRQFSDHAKAKFA